MNIKEIYINTRNWVDSVQDRDYWRALVNASNLKSLPDDYAHEFNIVKKNPQKVNVKLQKKEMRFLARKRGYLEKSVRKTIIFIFSWFVYYTISPSDV